MPERSELADAFAAQARSDWEVYRLLAASRDLPACHPLHYLQMATEKIAKAYRIRDLAADPDELARHHTGFVAFVNAFMNTRRDAYATTYRSFESRRKDFERIARAVELLAPAIDRLDTPENAEYPWVIGDRVVRPIDHEYPSLALLKERGGIAFLNLVEVAMSHYETTHL